MALTSQQRAFVEAYLNNDMANAAEAYRVAYPTSRKWTAAVVQRESAKMVAHPVIRPLIDEARAKRMASLAQSADRYAVSKERIVAALARMAFADPRKLFKWTAKGVDLIPSDDLSQDDAAAVVEVSHTVTAEGGTIRVKMGDKRQALMDLAKLHGYIVERKDVRLIKSIEDLSEAELAVLAATEQEETHGTKH